MKGNVDMSKAPSPGRQRLPANDEGDRLVLYPKKAKSGPKAAVDMSKQIGHFQDEGKHDVDEGNMLKLSPHRVKPYVRADNVGVLRVSCLVVVMIMCLSIYFHYFELL